MFDPHDYFDIRHNRAVCPVHGNKDRNLQIKRHKANDKWVFNCYSHNCTLKDIALAAGFNAKDIYDHHEPYIDISQYISTINKPIPQPTTTTEHTVEDPNPCTNLTLKHQDGTKYQVPCDLRRCPTCGPRKQKALKQSITNSIGEHIWIHRYETWDQVDRILTNAKKRKQRGGETYFYTMVGDDYLGYYLITNIPLDEHQRHMSLADWWDRIKRAYSRGDRRMRRSRGMSPVTLYRKTNRGQSLWRAVFGKDRMDESEPRSRFQGVETWDEMLEMTTNSENAREEAMELAEMWRMNTNVSHMPRRSEQSDALPDPY